MWKIIFWITYAMCSTFIFLCRMTMISKFTIFVIFRIFMFKFFFRNITEFCIFIWFLLLFCSQPPYFVLKLINSIEHSLGYSQNFFMQSLPLYTPWFSSKLLIDDIADIEKPYGICSSTFAVGKFSGFLFICITFFY